jgi:hypothetical protein
MKANPEPRVVYDKCMHFAVMVRIRMYVDRRAQPQLCGPAHADAVEQCRFAGVSRPPEEYQTRGEIGETSADSIRILFMGISLHEVETFEPFDA